ncbi:MAG: histidine--tRNA ligase [Candidatus Abyssobacteria bacterium SURF_5]|uniref:Histidine--tRNA ligase n=1 Tax=Abyssobacteria bacterium (strain SURF_5) TaxID=2093360 RepID=A0A3A4NCY6_ABYX5|nr:MAG: histidine--tRNA ligase [Candidatus Abyssubacteria bacterium SURF_5]
MGKAIISGPRGMYDILPDRIHQWRHLEDSARSLFSLFGYSEIRTPLVEETQLFARGIGETTDIVTKEMYTFADRKGRSLTLRPEGTASIVRAYVEHKLYAQQALAKLYYMGPMFRYERPQAGRNRQFFQIGAEAFGSLSPLLDFELIDLADSFFDRVGFKRLNLMLNSLGCAADRRNYAESLRAYFSDKLPMLCPDCIERLEKNPLRVLDCKVEACKALAAGAPPPLDHLCEDCTQHFKMLCSLLEGAGIQYVVDPRLVRGLDYYTRTVFEFQHPDLGARAAICGGGRYDNLVEEIGGPPTPASGFSIGVEATLLAMEKEELLAPHEEPPVAFICSIGERALREAALLAARLRNTGIKVEVDYEGRSLKAQMKMAHRLGVRFALILGEEELARDSARMREMATGEEALVSLRKIPARLAS